MDSGDLIEDLTINLDEVNESFRNGMRQQGEQYLQNVARRAKNDSILASARGVNAAIEKLKNRNAKNVNVIRELEKFGLDTEVIHRLGNIFVDAACVAKTITRMPSDEIAYNEYEEDFEEYDSEDENYSKVGIARTAPQPRNALVAPLFSKDPHVRDKTDTRPHTTNSIQTLTSQQKFKNASWINRGKWKLGEKIGSGSFGDVFQGLSDEGILFAVKRLSMGNTKEVANLTGEIELMQQLSHPNIVRYLGFKVHTVRYADVAMTIPQ